MGWCSDNFGDGFGVCFPTPFKLLFNLKGWKKDFLYQVTSLDSLGRKLLNVSTRVHEKDAEICAPILTKDTNNTEEQHFGTLSKL